MQLPYNVMMILNVATCFKPRAQPFLHRILYYIPFLDGRSSIENTVGLLQSLSFAKLDADENVITKLIQLQCVVDFACPKRVLTKTTIGIMFILFGTFHQVY